MLIILDDDLLDDIDHYKRGISEALGKELEWLVNEFHKMVTLHKERLPTRSRKFKYPTFIWVKIPNHEVYSHYNDFKDKYNDTLDRVCKLYREMSPIELDNRTWRRRELSYFAEGRISNVGLISYYQAICNTFENWDRDQMRAALAPKQNQEYRNISTRDTKRTNFDKNYHREKRNAKNTREVNINQCFKLPAPKSIKHKCDK